MPTNAELQKKLNAANVKIDDLIKDNEALQYMLNPNEQANDEQLFQLVAAQMMCKPIREFSKNNDIRVMILNAKRTIELINEDQANE